MGCAREPFALTFPLTIKAGSVVGCVPERADWILDQRTISNQNAMKASGSFRKMPGMLRIACLIATALPWITLPVAAAVVWSGPAVSFAEPGGSDPTLPSSQDRLTDNVWLTRGFTQGLFNAKSEGGYTHNFSPAGTEWAYGQLSDYA